MLYLKSVYTQQIKQQKRVKTKCVNRNNQDDAGFKLPRKVKQFDFFLTDIESWREARQSISRTVFIRRLGSC